MADVAVVLAGRYRLDAPIAAGGVGEVWRGVDLLLMRPVAVKLLRPEYALEEETVARFRAEARHAGALTHPAITRVYDFGEAGRGNPPFLVMELVEGESLASVLAGGPIGPARAAGVIAQAASGLQAAHAAGLVHRDIKPANLLIGPGWQVKITDFGIAHAAWSAPVTRPGTLVGTPAYMAPERAGGKAPGPASDLYSLGIVAWECLTGSPPFAGNAVEVIRAHRERPLPQLPPDVPAPVGRLIGQMTAKDPAARPATAGEVAQRAGDLLASLPLAGPARTARWPGVPVPEAPEVNAPTLVGLPIPAGSRPGTSQPRRRTLSARIAILAGAAAAVMIGLTGWLLSGMSGSTAAGQQGMVPPPAAGQATPAMVQVDSAALVGQPVDTVRQQLTSQGLNVRIAWQHGGGKPGTVVSVQPSGPVAAGGTVTVTAISQSSGDQHGNGGD